MDQKKGRKELFQQHVKELAIVDTAEYKEMMRMSHADFQRILSYIEQDITRKQVLGGNKVISPIEILSPGRTTATHKIVLLCYRLCIHGDHGYVFLIAHALAQQC